MTTTPMPFSEWAKRGEYPSRGVLYNWTRPSEIRDEMERAGVIRRVAGRWIFNPDRWRAYCEGERNAA